MKALFQFMRDNKGATSIEYALIGAIVSVGIIVGATNVGSSTNNVYDSIETQIRPELD